MKTKDLQFRKNFHNKESNSKGNEYFREFTNKNITINKYHDYQRSLDFSKTIQFYDPIIRNLYHPLQYYLG